MFWREWLGSYKDTIGYLRTICGGTLLSLPEFQGVCTDFPPFMGFTELEPGCMKVGTAPDYRRRPSADWERPLACGSIGSESNERVAIRIRKYLRYHTPGTETFRRAIETPDKFLGLCF